MVIMTLKLLVGVLSATILSLVALLIISRASYEARISEAKAKIRQLETR